MVVYAPPLASNLRKTVSMPFLKVALLFFLSSSPFAQAQNVESLCFPAGQEIQLPEDLGATPQVLLTKNSFIFNDESSRAISVYQPSNGQLQHYKKPEGARQAHLLQSGLVAFNPALFDDLNSPQAARHFIDYNTTHLFDPSTAKWSTMRGVIPFKQNLFRAIGVKENQVILQNQAGTVESIAVESTVNSQLTIARSGFSPDGLLYAEADLSGSMSLTNLITREVIRLRISSTQWFEDNRFKIEGWTNPYMVLRSHLLEPIRLFSAQNDEKLKKFNDSNLRMVRAEIDLDGNVCGILRENFLKLPSVITCLDPLTQKIVKQTRLPWTTYYHAQLPMGHMLLNAAETEKDAFVLYRPQRACVETKVKSYIADEDKIFWLKHMAQPGNFSAEKDLSALVEILNNSKFLQQHTSVVLAALGGVLHQSYELFHSLVSQYPTILASRASAENKFLAPGDAAKISKSAYHYALSRSTSPWWPDIISIELIAKQTRPFLSKQQKYDLADKISDRISSLSDGNHSAQRIFGSKIGSFVMNRILSAYDMENYDISDLTVTRQLSALLVNIIASKPFAGAVEIGSGLYSREVGRFNINQTPLGLTKNTYTWDHAGKSYRAEVTLTKVREKAELVTSSDSPNYAEMIARGQPFQGLSVISPNYKPEQLSYTLRQYHEYFRQNKFKITTQRELEDVADFIKQRISTFPMTHYFLKEAHSDSDEKHLFKVSRRGQLIVAEGIGPKGPEVFELVIPTHPELGSRLIGNIEFGQMIQKRLAQGGPELIYVNGSCNSHTKAVAEIIAAMTPKLIIIPTLGQVKFFSTSGKNAYRLLIDAIRAHRNFAEMKRELTDDPLYLKGVANVYLIPGEITYKRLINDYVQIPITDEVKVFVKDPTGQFVKIDDSTPLYPPAPL